MPSLQVNFEELLSRIQYGRELGHASYEPVYYLIFHPRQILDVKRLMPAWTARLSNDGYDVQVFSVAGAVADILSQTPVRKLWLAADRKSPLDWKKTNESLANALANGALVKRFEQALEQQHGSASLVEGRHNAIVLVTDLEALHPYMRIGTIESQLSGKFIVPTVFLYPGERTGKTKLKFLGFYPEDGNYRSLHIGG